MARKKKGNYNPLQYTLTFDIIANHIEKIKSENAKEDREDTVNVKQAVKSSGNSPKRTEVHNNVRHTHSGLQQGSLFDIGQMGAEPAERPAPTGSTGGNSFHVSPDTSDESGNESFSERSGGRSPEAGDERLGDFAEPRDRHQPQDFRITPDIQLGYGGAKTKYADNIAAIKLVQDLQARNVTVATPEEQKILVRYVGWGGLPQVFDPQNEKWSQEYQELKALLPPDAYANARRSTQDAHFTSETVINGIYQGLERLGVQQDAPLRVLEPSAGIGNFLGLMPHENTRVLAVEQDTVTSAIAKYLYPTAHHLNTGFQYVDLKQDSFDLTVGNPPFGSQSLYDASAPELRGMSIHNYFLAKSLKSLRTGGIGAFVVSRYFMDSQDCSVREHIAQYADLLGAIRLPDMAFQQNALTKVTTDLVFFRKHDGKSTQPLDWVKTSIATMPDTKHGGEREGVVNRYFVQHPEQIIGTLTFAGGMHENDLSCIAPEIQDLGKEISERLAALPTSQFIPRVAAEEKAVEAEKNTDFISSEYFQSLKMGAFCFEPKSRKIVFKVSGAYGEPSYDEVAVKNDVTKHRLIGLISVRDSLRALLTAEKDDVEPQKIEELRQSLNTHYDRFIRTFGHINSQTNRSLMREDPEYSLLASLELDYDKGVSKELAKKHGVPPRRPTAKKATIFTQRVLKPAIICDSADTVQDALLITLREKGQVVLPRIAELLGRPEEDVRKELQHEGLIFLNPRTLEWEIRDKYLTGNVRRKLDEAIEAAKQAPRFAQNVEALRAAMPPEIEAVDIGVKFGSTWLPPAVISDFINEVIHQGNGHQRIDYIPLLGRWDAKVHIYDRTAECDVWGIPECPASKLIECLLTNRPIKVEKETGRDHNGKPIMTIDQELTAAAMQKADGIKRAFLDWVWTDDARRASLTRIYNERFNTHVPPRYDGSHIQLVGASSDISLRPHQKDAVWRGIQAGTALFDHVVGAGKTLACIATIMESKRMGFIAKPMVVVPNQSHY